MIHFVGYGERHKSHFCHFLRSEEHTSELQSPYDIVCRLLLEKKKRIHQLHDNSKIGAPLISPELESPTSAWVRHCITSQIAFPHPVMTLSYRLCSCRFWVTSF